MLVVAEAMSESKNWNFLAQYSILKEMLADLRTIAITWQEKDATEHMEEEMGVETVEHVGENEKAADDIDQGEGLATVLSEMEREVKDEGNKAGAGEEEPGWIRTFEDFFASLWWRWGEETNVAMNPSVKKEVPTLGVGAHQEVLQPEEVDDEQFEKELQQLEERMEEHEHDADAHQDAKVQENQVALEEQVGNKCFHLVLQFKTLVGGADEHRAG